METQAPIETGLGMDLDGSITRLDVYEAVPEVVSHVIRTNEVWGVNLQWEFSSDTPNNPHHPLLRPCIFNVRVYLEGFGPDPNLAAGVTNEFVLPLGGPFEVNYWAAGSGNPGGIFLNPNTRRWDIRINFPPQDVAIPPGLYKLGVTLVLLQPVAGGDPLPLPVAGYIEGPLLHFYVTPVPTP